MAVDAHGFRKNGRPDVAADLLRDVNDQIRQLAGQFGSDISGRFVCECDDPECMEPVVITLDEFDERRRSSTSPRIVAHD